MLPIHELLNANELHMEQLLRARLSELGLAPNVLRILKGQGITTLKELDILPFVQPYRDFENKRKPTAYEQDLARWANRAWLFKSCDFMDFSPRKGFKCKEYFK